MARRSSTSTAPKSTEQAQEATVSTTTTEAAPEAPETTETKAKAEETPIDLTAFQKAATEAVGQADTSTGEIAVALIEPVVKEYRALDGVKPKNAAKHWLTEQMKDQMNKGSIQGARSYLQLQESMTAGSGGGAAKAPADPTQAFVQRVATLNLAYNLVVGGEVPEGVAEDWSDKAQALVGEATSDATKYLAWVNDESEDKGDEPEVSPVVKNAVKLAVGKSAKAGGRASGGGTFTGERRDIGKHIAEAFAEVESGTFLTVAEIRNHKSAEYGDNPPSAGAISARLFPANGKCTVEGITPGTNEKGNKGATKA